jgi:hypothetical protein
VRVFPLRCINLQELDVNWQDDAGRECFLCFKGEGSTPPEQRASMERQLEALWSSTAFMAPESWPACSCLVSFTVRQFKDLHRDTCFKAAVRTPSLACLDIGEAKRQKFSSHADDPGALGDDDLAAIGQLRNLRQLHIGIMQLPRETGFAQALTPSSWSALSSLTWVEVTKCEGREISVPHLSNLVAVERLGMHEAVSASSVESLFALTRLTRLDGPNQCSRLDSERFDAEAGSSSSSSSSWVLEVPQPWRDGLQHLHWNDDRSGIAMVPQLTSLTFLELYDVVVTPDLCRWGREHGSMCSGRALV